MKRYILKKLLFAVPAIFFIIIFAFILIHLQPGDPISLLVGEFGDPAYIAKVRQEYGLDKPLYEQLAIYVSKAVQGDFGRSVRYNMPVLNLILEKVPATLLLLGVGTTFSVVAGIFLGIISAKKVYSYTDSVVMLFATFGNSMPSFLIGQFLLLIFVYYLGFFPTSGMFTLTLQGGFLERLVDLLWHLVLPALAWSLSELAMVARLTRANMLEVLGSDYIVTARAKGLDDNVVVYKHAFKNACLPVITLIGLSTGRMIAGSVLIETVFAWPGVGRLMYEALINLDYPVLMGVFITLSISMVFVAILIDILYSYIDPRIRYR